MTTPASMPPADTPPSRSGWLVLTASERGASHVQSKLPNQDSVVTESVGPAGVVAAVADGHGHWRHVRSARGSRLAVDVGCQVGQELAGMLGDGESGSGSGQGDDPPRDLSTATQISELVRDLLVPAIVRRWRSAVLADVAAAPFTDAEEDLRQNGDDPTIAYGSTLLLAVALRQWLVLAQIGDGDMVGVRADGSAVLPVPDDPQLDGRYTTSLCGPDARSDFRVAVIDTSQAALVAVLLATDGYGNAQIADQWAGAFSADLAGLLRERDEQWLASQLPSWAARCASAEGSADDTTVALLLAPHGLPRTVTPPTFGPSGQAPNAGSEETTVPAVIHADTVPSAQALAGQGPAEPVTVRLGTVPPAGPDVAGVQPAATLRADITDIADIADPAAAPPPTVQAVVVDAADAQPAATVQAVIADLTPAQPTTVQAVIAEPGGPGPEPPETTPWQVSR
jgi:hypothetical protein